MVSFGGRLLGALEDALVDERDGRIIGYPLERTGPGTWIEALFGMGLRSERSDYVRADAALRIGARLIVVPDEAIASVGDLQETPPETHSAIPAPPIPHFDHSPAEIQAAQSTTSQFSMSDVLTSDEEAASDIDGAASFDHSDFERHEVDPEEDTGLIAAVGESRTRPRRRPQAQRMR
jgi:hypothetical protein